MGGDNGNGPGNPGDCMYRRQAEANLALDLANQACTEVWAFGARKHAADPLGWLDKPVDFHIAALKRKLDALDQGETLDRESKLSLLAHIYARAKMAMAVTCRPR